MRAIGYARDGMAVSRSLADWLAQDEPILATYPATAAIFLPGGHRSSAKVSDWCRRSCPIAPAASPARERAPASTKAR